LFVWQQNDAGKLCHSLLQNCSLHTLCMICVLVIPFEHIENFIFPSLCAVSTAGSVFVSCGM